MAFASQRISRTTADEWMRRWLTKGETGLRDRSSRPLTTPNRTAPRLEAQVCRLRQTRHHRPAPHSPANPPISRVNNPADQRT